MTLEPYSPRQTGTGETYVVDARSNRIVRTILSTFDTTERWREAQRIARIMNAEHSRRTYLRRQRWTVAVLVILVVGGAVELGTGELTALAERVISLAP